jgi:hypothetical protein
MDFIDDVIAHCTALGMPPKKITLNYELYDALKEEMYGPTDVITIGTGIEKYMTIELVPRIERGFVMKVEQ